MNILIVSEGQYPDIHAPAIRHSTLAQGLVETGHNAEFLIIGKQNWKSKTMVYKGITYTSISFYKGRNKLLKKIYSIIEMLFFQYIIHKQIQSNYFDAVICFSINKFIIKTAQKACSKNRIPIFHERTELPYIIGLSNNLFGRIKYKNYLHKQIPKFDGIFVISDKLKKFFLNYNPRIIKLLTVVDTNFFEKKHSPPFDFPYIAYCGKISKNKDGVPILIESFSKLSKKYPSLKLVIIGNTTDKNLLNELQKKIKELKLKDKIIFTGIIKRVEMPNYLGHSKLLVLAKPNNEQNTGNFPIKVGEYLSTGIPTVITKVGEIPKYIIDGETGYLAEPNSSVSFYNKMDEALSDYNRAIRIGKKGQKTAKELFDYKTQTQVIIKAINQERT